MERMAREGLTRSRLAELATTTQPTPISAP
nr:hypothetical protein [Cupriavidus gilardii]